MGWKVAVGVDGRFKTWSGGGSILGRGFVAENELDFTYSYDWAYLLLKKCFHLGKSKEAYARIAYNGMMEAGFNDRPKPPQPEIATPAQISFACIEVLEGLC